ncbi:PREDICTED: WD repeat-containing protein 48-like isoform X2 [Nicotiana attenuata]|uniref:WD repeat-containing protein 48-like isoform X2 n=1 Tax=Nicotiana attenuata TaxID=49451 RepID=UPI0009052324|nr:PREDICTED: WD repeat-containing protein 48-like isoform X2 [Nicotiana attenuata]
MLGLTFTLSLIVRLWDLGQQRCVHSYAVHTDSVWALASTPTFSHVYSGGRDLSLYLTYLATRESILLCTKEHPILHCLNLQLYLTYLATRESILLCTKEHPILQLELHGDSMWVATTDSSVHKWPAEGRSPQKVFERGGSFLTGNLSFSRARVSLEGSTPVSIPAWFTMDTRLGSLAVHLDTPQCFSAEMYSADLNIPGKPEDDKVNLARETLKGLLVHGLIKRRQKFGSQPSSNGEVPSGKDVSARILAASRVEVDSGADNDSAVFPPFEFSAVSPPSVVTEGSQSGPWRKKITDLDGTEDEKDMPWWVIDCVMNNRLPPRENTKCSLYLHPCEGSTFQILTQGKLSAPRISRIHKVINYVVEKMVLDKPLDSVNSDGTFTPGMHGVTGGDGSFRTGPKPWQKLKPSIDILCNNQVLSPDMSLATVRAYIWKKPEDLVLNYRVLQSK